MFRVLGVYNFGIRVKNENCSTCNQIAELRKWLYLKFVGGFQIYILFVDFIKALLTCKKSEETIVHRGQACTYGSSSTCQNDSNHHSWNYQKSKITILSQFYIQLVNRPHSGTWILLFGPFGQSGQSGKTCGVAEFWATFESVFLFFGGQNKHFEKRLKVLH